MIMVIHGFGGRYRRVLKMKNQKVYEHLYIQRVHPDRYYRWRSWIRIAAIAIAPNWTVGTSCLLIQFFPPGRAKSLSI